jgi:hypothetical protein
MRPIGQQKLLGELPVTPSSFEGLTLLVLRHKKQRTENPLELAKSLPNWGKQLTNAGGTPVGGAAHTVTSASITVSTVPPD